MLLLRPFQSQAIETLLAPEAHLLCVSPTGSGKSRIYETLAWRHRYRTLLITPLVALARQQRAKLECLGLSPRLLAGQGPEGGKSDVWIVSPERLRSQRLRRALQQKPFDLWVIDECHCLWEWGEDFRPAFREVLPLLKWSRPPRSLWLTATLPGEARRELQEALPEPRFEQGSFRLPESVHLSSVRVSPERRWEMVIDWVCLQARPGILFVASRNLCDRLCLLFQGLGRRTVSYHAGLSREERLAVEEQVAKGDLDVIVATSAFGMGMDYPHLGWVAHFEPPFSLLALAQAVGRVGRGGSDRPSQARIFWNPGDFERLRAFLPEGRRRQELERLQAALSGSGTLEEVLGKYFSRSGLS